MKAEDLRPGTIIRYPYLWSWQHTRGETEGRKLRPVCMIYSQRDPKQGITHLFLLVISSQPPLAASDALVIPDLDRRRAGLGEWKDAWITVNETNYDILEMSRYLDLNQTHLGSFSPSYLRTVATAFRDALIGGARRVDRTT
jgi:hypothetical protein